MHDDPFEEALEGAEERFSSANAEARQERWEERVVKRLVQAHVGASDAASVIREMKEAVRETTGQSSLTFDLFVVAYPAFPIWIVSRPISYAHERTDMCEFFAKHEHLFPHVFNEAKLKIPGSWEGRPYGVAFEMANKHGPCYLLHNHEVPPGLGAKGCDVRVTDPKRMVQEVMYFTKLEYFLHQIRWLKAE